MWLKRKNELLAVMRRENISARYLAKKIGVQPATLYRYLSGDLRIPLERSKMLMDILGGDVIADAVDWEVIDARRKS